MSEVTGGADRGDMGDFHVEISSLQDSLNTFHSNVARIDNLHSQSLNNADDAVSQRSAALSAELVEETNALSVLSATLKRRIQELERQPARGRDTQVQQTALIKSKFLDMIQNYKQVEERYRQWYKLRIERQLRIVKPDATPEEIRAVVNDESGGQLFSQALMDLNSHGDSRATYREVQSRHQDLQRTEQTIAELTQLFNDMNIRVEPQSEAIDNVETRAVIFEEDLEAKLNIARATTRKWLWIISVFIIVVILVTTVTIAVKNTKHK